MFVWKIHEENMKIGLYARPLCLAPVARPGKLKRRQVNEKKNVFRGSVRLFERPVRFFRCWKQMKCVCDLFDCCFSFEINFKLRAHSVWNGQTCTREQPPAFRNHNWWTWARSYDWSSNISYSIKWILLLFVKCYHVCDHGSISVVSPFRIIIRVECVWRIQFIYYKYNCGKMNYKNVLNISFSPWATAACFASVNVKSLAVWALSTKYTTLPVIWVSNVFTIESTLNSATTTACDYDVDFIKNCVLNVTSK